MDSKIEYSITLDNDLHVVHIQAHGILNISNVQELSIKAREMASQHNCGIFYDFRDISLDASTFDIYNFPRENKAVEDIHHRHNQSRFSDIERGTGSRLGILRDNIK